MQYWLCYGPETGMTMAILDGRQPTEMTLAVLMRPVAVGWRRQVRDETWFAEGDAWDVGKLPSLHSKPSQPTPSYQTVY